MDRLRLEVLAAELREDEAVIRRAAALAHARLADDHPGHLEACGFELHRAYSQASLVGAGTACPRRLLQPEA